MIRKAGTATVAVLSVAALAAPSLAQARRHPSPNGHHRVNIFVSENPITYGDPLVIFGRVIGPNNGTRQVVLWHRVNGQGSGFTVVQTGTTDAAGFYAFNRLSEVVNSNREWYVTALRARSRTIKERVVDVVTLNGPPDGTQLMTGPPATSFTGTVSPNDAGQQIVLQRQNAASGAANWNTIQRGVVGPNGSFTFNHVFKVAGDANLRALVPADRTHLASPSPLLNYEISQAQNPGITISSSVDPIPFGGATTISGTVASATAGATVTLLAKTAAQPGFTPVATTPVVGATYAFAPQSPQRNTEYETQLGSLTSAHLYEGVRDVLTASESPSMITQGQAVTFSGTVAPDHSGHVIWLQKQNAAGTGFHTVQVARILPGSTYTMIHQIFAPGTYTFRVQIPGGPENQGAVSQTFTVTVTGLLPAQLPQVQPAAQSQGQ